MSVDVAAWPSEEVEEHTDPETGIRHYRWPGHPWRVSVTTVLGVIAKGWRYDNWNANEERSRWKLKTAEVLTEPMEPAFMLAEIERRVGGRFAYTIHRDEAAGEGKAVHDAVRAYLAAEVSMLAPPIPKLSPAELVSFSDFVTWWKGSRLRAVKMEAPVYDAEWNAAGRLDIYAERPDLRRGIVDLKRTKWISDNYHLQVAEYMRCVRQWDDASWGVIVKLPKGGRGLEIRNVGEGMWAGDRTIAQCEMGFKAALDLWRCLNRGRA